MNPRKRRRQSDKEEKPVASTSGSDMTNSAMQQFLGPMQKSWMSTGGHQARSITRPSRPPAVTTAPAPTTREASSTSATTAVSTQGRTLQPESRRDSSTSLPTHRTLQNASNQGHMANMSNSKVDAPSHSPSESMDLRPPSAALDVPSIPGTTTLNEANAVMDSPRPVTDGGSTETPVSQASETARLAALAAKYGGLAQLEKELEKARRMSEQPSNSASPNPRATHQRIQESSMPEALASPATNQALNPQPARLVDPTRFSQPVTTQSPVALGYPQGTTTPQEILTHEKLISMHEALGHRLRSLGSIVGLTNEQRGLEESRLILLQDACAVKDVLYLVLHQVFCLRDVLDLDSFLKTFHLRANQQLGLHALRDLMVPNGQLALESLRWFSFFPGNPALLTRKSRTYADALKETAKCLRKLGANWENFVARCRERKELPFVATMEEFLDVRSTVLQRVIFQAICRSMWLLPQDKCLEACGKLFQLNQGMSWWWTGRNGNSGTSTETERGLYHSHLRAQYQSLISSHQRHVADRQPEYVAGLVAVLQAWEQEQAKLIGHPLLDNNLGYMHSQETASSARATQYLQLSPQAQTATQSPPTNNETFSSAQVNAFGRRLSSTVTQTQLLHQHQPTHNLQHANETRIPPSQQVPPTPPAVNDRAGPFQPSLGPSSSPLSAGTQNLPARNLVRQSEQLRQAGASTRHCQQPVQRPSYANANINANASTIQPDTWYSQAIIRETIPTSGVQNQPVLFAPAEWRRHAMPQPPSQGASLHQAHLREARIVQADTLGTEVPATSLLSFFKGFLLEPFTIKPQSHVPTGIFNIPNDLYQRIPRDRVDGMGAPPTRQISLASNMVRLRCLKAYAEVISEADWATQETAWPTNIAMSLNSTKSLEVRRKAEHGRDLPIDITSLVVPGENKLQVALIRPANNSDSNTSYVVGVELLEMTGIPTMKQAVRNIPATRTRERICRQLQSTDDEIQILSHDLVISVTDPFTSRPVENPVRGAQCVHYECFDVDVFLETRTAGVWRPEQFKCPICGSDARPQSLERDEWFVEVVKELREMGRLDVSAIVVDQQAGWKIKEVNVEGESGDGSGRTRGGGKEGSVGSRKMTMTPEVIELD